MITYKKEITIFYGKWFPGVSKVGDIFIEKLIDTYLIFIKMPDDFKLIKQIDNNKEFDEFKKYLDIDLEEEV